MGELTPLGQGYGIDLVNVDNSAFLPWTVICEEGSEVRGNVLFQEADSLRLP